MNNAKRFLAALLCALMVVPTLAACANDGDAPADDTAAAADTTVAEDTTPAETDRSQAKDNLPEGLNFNGMEVKFHTRGGQNRELDINGAGEEVGDLVKDAVYQKMRSVEDRLGVKIVCSENTEGYKQLGAEVEAAVLAGDDTWQVIATSSNATVQFARDYLWQPVQDNQYLDFDQPWWWKDAMYELSLDTKTIRYILGDTNLSAYNYCGAILYNKAQLENFGEKEEDLYNLVFEGKWTMDKLGEYATKTNKDLDGDGALTINDTLGFFIDTFEYLKFLEYGCDVRRYTRNDKGLPVVDLDLERADLAINKMLKLIKETKGSYWDSAEKNPRRDLLAAGNIVFWGTLLGDAYNSTVRGMESEYGVIPFPKLDDKQEAYTTFIHNSAGMMTIPITNKNPDVACAVLEAMCSEAYRSVISVYFDAALKGKYSSDPNSAKCVDIIRAAARKYFFAEYNATAVSGGQIGFLFSNQVKNGANTLASTYASIKDAAATALNAFIEDQLGKMK